VHLYTVFCSGEEAGPFRVINKVDFLHFVQWRHLLVKYQD